MKNTFWLIVMLTSLSLVADAQQIIPGKWVPNKRVNDVKRIGDMTYVSGLFTEVARANPYGIIFHPSTDEFNHASSAPSGPVMNALPDYNGGFFVYGPGVTAVGEAGRDRLAHIYSDGSVSPNFNPKLENADFHVRLLASATDRLFIFTSGEGSPAVNTIVCLDYFGNVIWSRRTNNYIGSAVIHNSVLYISGQFTSVEGEPRQHAAAFDYYSGNVLPWNTGTAIPALRPGNLTYMGVWQNEIFIRYTGQVLSTSAVKAFNLSNGAETWNQPMAPSSTYAARAYPMMVSHGKLFFSTGTGTGLVVRDAISKDVILSPDIEAISPAGSGITQFSRVGARIYALSRGFENSAGQELGDVISFDASTNEVFQHNITVMNVVNEYSPLTNERIYCIAASGNNVYIGGDFAGVRPLERNGFYGFNKITNELSPLTLNEPATPNGYGKMHIANDRIYIHGPSEDDRPHGLRCFDANTGEPIDWNPNFNFSQSSYFPFLFGDNDQFYLYSGYDAVNGQPAKGIALFDAATGDKLNWQPEGDYTSVHRMTTDASNVYLIVWNAINTRYELRAVSKSTGAQLFPPVPFGGGDFVTNDVNDLVARGNKLYVGGTFQNAGEGQSIVAREGFAVIDLPSGTISDQQLDFTNLDNRPVNFGWLDVIGVTSLSASTSTLYINGRFDRVGNLSREFIAAMDLSTGDITAWTVDLKGSDSPLSPPIIHGIYPSDDCVYIAGDYVTVKTPSMSTPEFYPTLVSLTPDRSNRITGRVFYDPNQNGTQDADETGIPNLLMELQPGNIYYPTDENGNYTIYAATGEFTVRPITPAYTLLSSPESRDVAFSDFLQQSVNNDFAVDIQMNATDLSIEVIADQEPRPGFYFSYFVRYKNEGTVVSDGAVQLLLDSRLLVQSHSILPSASSGNLFTYELTDLQPGESGAVIVRVRVPVPTVNGSLLGEILNASATIVSVTSDVNPLNNQSQLAQTVIGSLDPNDKLVTPEGVGINGYIDEDTEFLEYTIRFQNMGTAPAEFVIVTDILDENLNVSSFEYLSSSHDNTYEIVDRTLTVTFNNIQLPAESVDEPGSHGFFTFRIYLNEDLPSRTRIENQASIVFDYNLPIVTNTTVNTLLDPPYSTAIYLPDSVVTRNNQVLFPVFVTDFENILGEQFSISWDPAIASFVGVEGFAVPGLSVNSFNLSNTSNGSLSMAWSDPTATSQTLPDSSVLFMIRFVMTGNYGDMTNVSITHSPTSIEAVAADYETLEVLREDGSIQVDPDLTIRGTILYPNEEPVQNVSISLSGSQTAQTASDDAGEFELTVQPSDENASYTLSPTKDNDPDVLNGIDVQDIAAIRRHILTTEPFTSAFQTIAADVSDNQNVSIQDIVILQSVILGLQSEFPNERHWTFVDAAHEFTSVASPFPYAQTIAPSLTDLEQNVTSDFFAIKVGDIDLSRDNTQSGRSAPQEVVLEISAPRETTKGIVEIEVRAFGFVDISAYQFTLQWDASQLELLEKTENGLTASYGSHRMSEGLLSTIWDNPEGSSTILQDGAVVLTLRFNSLTSDPITNALNITGHITPIKMFGGRLEPVAVFVRQGTEEDKLESGIFYPNPFVDETRISFTALESQEAQFQIVDATGKVIAIQPLSVQKGWNEKVISGTNLKPGVYMLSLQLKDRRISGKMVKGQQ